MRSGDGCANNRTRADVNGGKEAVSSTWLYVGRSDSGRPQDVVSRSRRCAHGPPTRNFVLLHMKISPTTGSACTTSAAASIVATMSKRKADSSASASSSPEPDDKKRKFNRDEVPEDEKLEINVAAPEPPSKKALRAEKKRAKEEKKAAKAAKKAQDGLEAARKAEAGSAPTEDSEAQQPAAAAPAVGQPASTAPPKRSDYGIWIGNLPWTVTRDSLRTFFKDQGSIWDRDIVRVHMPPPAAKPTDGPVKPQNKGFAYVDFTTPEILEKAIGLSEKLLMGRRVLIKHAKSFEGRPDKPKVPSDLVGKTGSETKAPTNKIFVGNLGFDVTRDDLAQHFAQAGMVEDIHMATFEDSGKSKGYAWVRFADVEGAEAAVRGFVYRTLEEDEDMDGEDSEEDDSDDGAAKKGKKRSSKKHKQHINRLHGRELRCEFAEDAQTRYKKRFGKAPAANGETGRDRRDPRSRSQFGNVGDADTGAGAGDLEEAPKAKSNKKHGDKEQRRDERRKRHDARTIAPGKALANAPRSSGAIVAGSGKKVTFD